MNDYRLRVEATRESKNKLAMRIGLEGHPKALIQGLCDAMIKDANLFDILGTGLLGYKKGFESGDIGNVVTMTSSLKVQHKNKNLSIQIEGGKSNVLAIVVMAMAEQKKFRSMVEAALAYYQIMQNDNLEELDQDFETFKQCMFNLFECYDGEAKSDLSESFKDLLKDSQVEATGKQSECPKNVTVNPVPGCDGVPLSELSEAEINDYLDKLNEQKKP